MIEVENVSKLFGNFRAVDGISFSIQTGEIVGLLGPNGAGKTTTMRMISGFLEPDSGTVKIDGLDVLKNPVETKRKIGYMPESAPMYSDMIVADYLKYIAEIENQNPAEKCRELAEVCGLKEVMHKNIGGSSSTHCLLNGIVAELEHVPNAFNAAGIIARKKRIGLIFPSAFTAAPYTTNANPKNAIYKITSCVAKDTIVFVPFASTTGTIVQNTPIGVKYITVLIILRHTSLRESTTFNNGSPFSPIAINVNPIINENTSTCSIFPSANAFTGLEGIRLLTVSKILSIFVA